MTKKKDVDLPAFNVYEVEVATGIEGYRVQQHVRARDEAEAEAKVQVAQGPGAQVIRTELRRLCLAHENADEARKAGV